MITPELTPRQRKYVKFVIEGLSNKEIANKLGVSVNTINIGIWGSDGLFQRIGVRTRQELIGKFGHFEVQVVWVPRCQNT